MKVTVTSFSFKRGLPDDPTDNGGGFVFDCRAMSNPFGDEIIRGYTGRDNLQVAFGCTGGQHRSVYFAERMAERLSGIDGVEVEVSHTEQ